MSDSILLSMLACIYTLNVADYYLTLSAVSKGATEANPIMAAILHTPMFPVVKLFCIPAILCMIWVARANVRPAIVRVVWVPVVAYVLLGMWHLYVAMLFWDMAYTLHSIFHIPKLFLLVCL